MNRRYGNYQFNQSSYQGYAQGHVQAPYNPNYKNAPRKKSGCKEGIGKNQKAYISGWNKSRQGFVTFIACQNSEEHRHKKSGKVITNKKGEEYTRWTATIVNHSTKTESKASCLYNHTTGKLRFTTLNMVANPKAPNGGYFGRSGRPKNR